MYRPLRWYERLMLRVLARSPRIDLLFIAQFPGTPDQRRKMSAEVRRTLQADLLEELFQRPD